MGVGVNDIYIYIYCAKVLTQRVKGQAFYDQWVKGSLCWETCLKLILKNLYRTENTLSGAWFCELLSDCSKRFLGLRTL